jgi:hypothetical protein
VLYNKEIQTADLESDSDRENDDAAHQRQQKDREREIEADRLREKELEEESIQLDREIEEAIRGWCIRHVVPFSALTRPSNRTDRRGEEHDCYCSGVYGFHRAILEDRTTSTERQV